MNLTEQLLSYARTHFNVAGVYQISNIESALILGLESTPQRNLDKFSKIDNKLHMTGFAEHFQPGLESILNWLKEKGIPAKEIGKYGYASQGAIDFINYKQAAIKAGLGKRGKNTLVINEVYGTRLRFAALKLNTLLETTEDNPDEENPFCQSCSVCIDECPVNILEPYRMLDTANCLSNISSNVAVFKDKQAILCDICLKKCPANQIGIKA